MKYCLRSAFYCIVFSLFALNLSAQNNITFLGQLSYSIHLSNLWGYVDSISNEYALVGTQQGLSIVDVTIPANPVEKFSVTGNPSPWREVKTYGHRAYVTTEGGGGVMIVNLSKLPDSIHYHFFTDSGKLNTAHTLWIDEKGFLYIFGSNVGKGGAQIYDLKPDPDTPVYAGQYDDYYIHDGFVRGDTLWASHIYAGNLEVVNVANKTAPAFLQVFNTPGNFTHNSWPTNDDHYLFTTDEVANSFLTAFDVHDLFSVQPIDKIQADSGSGSTVHNVLLYNNDFATTSYYCKGIVIFDVTHPDNMIETGNYNTSESSCSGYNGCWGVYPYLPSGNIIASDIQNGLFVLKPNYNHACWLNGFVTDSITANPLINVNVSINNTTNSTFSLVDGSYRTGVRDSGFYAVTFSVRGYYSKTITNIHFVNGIMDTLNVVLKPLPYFTLTGTVFDSVTLAFISNAQILFSNGNSNYMDSTDINGGFTIPNFYPGAYKALVGKWGYNLYYKGADSILNGTLNYNVKMHPGYYDDFSLNLGWKDSSTATLGKWVRGVPIGTLIDSEYVNPDMAVSMAHNNECYMTGNSGGYYRSNCLTGGFTKLTSPLINLSKYTNPYLSYYTWFFDMRNKLQASDSLVISIISKGITKTMQSLKLSNTDSCEWVFQKLRIKDYVPLSDSMYVSVIAENTDSANNIFKAAVDVFQITDSIGAGINILTDNASSLSAYPNPFEDDVVVSYNISSVSNGIISISDITGRELYEEKLTADKGIFQINLKYYPTGIYILQLKDGNILLKTLKMTRIN